MFSSVGIKIKLIIPVALLICVTIWSTVVLVGELNPTNSTFESLIKTKLKARFVLKDITAHLSRKSGRLANLMLLQHDPADIKTSANKLEGTLNDIGKLKDELKALVPDYEMKINLVASRMKT